MPKAAYVGYSQTHKTRLTVAYICCLWHTKE